MTSAFCILNLVFVSSSSTSSPGEFQVLLETKKKEEEERKKEKRKERKKRKKRREEEGEGQEGIKDGLCILQGNLHTGCLYRIHTYLSDRALVSVT